MRTGFRRAQQWRSVVATLTPERLRAIYWALANGSWCPDYFELAEEIEERDLHYRGVLQQRRLRGAGAPIDVVPASDAAADRHVWPTRCGSASCRAPAGTACCSTCSTPWARA